VNKYNGTVLLDSYDLGIVVNYSPIASFSFTSDSLCSGIPILFTNTSYLGGPTATYKWNFGDGISSTSMNPLHTFNAIGNSISSLNTWLVVTNQNGCKDSVSHIVTVKQIPDASLKSDGSSGFQNEPSIGTPTTIKKCILNPTLHELKLMNISSTSTTNTNYNINYGDGTPYNGSVFDPGSHIYPSSGAYILTNTVTATNGCVASKTYDVYIGANPSGSIINPGGTILQHCAPHTYDFPLAPNVLQNTPGTIYTFNFNDGSPTITFNQSQLNSPPFFNSGGILYYPHTFFTGSCNAPNTHGVQLYNHSFYIKLDIENACTITTSTAQPIVLVSPPTADFNIQPATCTNTLVSLTNNSYGACNINWNGSNYIIDTNVSQNWIITPSTYTIINGNLNSSNLTVSFLQAGIYSIKLISSNNCSSDTIIKTICVSPIPVPGFTLDQTSLCNPGIVNITNTTDETGFCNTPTYSWSISCTNNNCDATVCNIGYSFAGGTSANSKNPIISFTKPGIYNLSLTVNNGCSLVTSGFQTITVKDKPFIQTLTLSPIAPYCLGDNICVSAVVKDCYGTQSTTYNWTSTSVNFPNTNQLNPGCITANTLGAQSITQNATNECGTTTKTESFNVTQLCNNNTIVGDSNICQGQVSNTYSIQGIPNAITYNWSIMPQNAGNITGTDTSVTILWNSAYTGTATLSVYGTNGVSNSNTANLTVNIKPLPTATISVSGNTTVCQNDVSPIVTFMNPQTVAINVTYTINGGPNLTVNVAASSTANIAAPTTTAGIFIYSLVSVSYQSITLCSNNIANTTTITVIPLPTVNPIPNQTICNGSTTLPIIFTGSCSGATYNWTISNPSIGIGLAASGVGSILPFTATNTSNAPITTTITVIPFCNGCYGTPYSFSITVYNSPVINPIQSLTQSLQTICNGDTTAAISFTGTGTSYNWTNSNPSIGLAANGTGNIPSFTAINTGTTPNIGIITITPYSQFCSGFPITDTIIVNPTPIVNQPANLVYCNGDATSIISFTGTGTSYDWTNNNTSIGLAANGTGNISSFISTNTGVTQIIATITVTPKYTNGSVTCFGTSKTFTITINPLPVSAGTISGLTSVCQGDSNVNYSVPAIANATSYLWTLPNGASGTSSTNSISVNYGASASTGVISVKGTNSCGDGSLSNLAVTVNPLPASAGSITGLTIVCQGESNVNYTVPAITNATSYIWTLANGASGTSSSNSIIVNYGNSAVSGNITVKGVNICGEGGVSTLAVIVNQKPQTPVITQNGDSLKSDALIGNQWYNLTTGIINNANGQLYFPQQSGYYFTITTLNGCSSDTSNIIYFDNTGIVENQNNLMKIKVMPNPFTDKTTLSYTLTENKHIRLSITDITGKELKVLCNSKQGKGEHSILINLEAFPAGIYFYKLYADKEMFAGKIILKK
jgi:PKD repeat protein